MGLIVRRPLSWRDDSPMHARRLSDDYSRSQQTSRVSFARLLRAARECRVQFGV